MDEDNLKMMPLLVSPLDSEKLETASVMDIIKERELILAEIKKKEMLLAESKKKQKLLLAEIKATELLLADIKKKELLLEVENNKMKQRFLSFLAVLAASLWALMSACLLGGLSAYNIFGLAPSTSDQECSESKTCYVLPCAITDEVNAILYGLLCCSVLQAAAAELALVLLLTGGRRRRTLAYTALAATTVCHCMHGRLRYLLLAASTGDDSTTRLGLAILDLVVDLLCFLFLILTRDDEDGGKHA